MSVTYTCMQTRDDCMLVEALIDDSGVYFGMYDEVTGRMREVVLSNDDVIELIRQLTISIEGDI